MIEKQKPSEDYYEPQFSDADYVDGMRVDPLTTMAQAKQELREIEHELEATKTKLIEEKELQKKAEEEATAESEGKAKKFTDEPNP